MRDAPPDAQPDAPTGARPLGVLFLCVANSARSQMAEAWARHLLDPALWRVWSAGSRPSAVHPLAVEVMAEVGLDLADHRSKSVEDIDPACIDVVVTLCAEEVCPAFLAAARRLHWPLPDPAAPADPAAPPGPKADAESPITRFRAVRDRLRELVRGLP